MEIIVDDHGLGSRLGSADQLTRGRWRANGRTIAVACGLLTGGWACGPDSADGPPLTCGQHEPMRLLPDAAYGYPTYAGDRIAVSAVPTWMDAWLPQSEAPFTFRTVGPCGEAPTEVTGGEAGPLRWLGAAGGHVLAETTDEAVHWVDPHGTRPSHRLVGSLSACVVPVAGGLVVQEGRRVSFFADPADPDRGRVLVDEAIVGEQVPYSSGYEFDDCGDFYTQRPVADGDGVLIARDGGPLERIALPGGASETIVDGPVGEFALLDNPRYLLWRQGHTPDGGCCWIHLLDRATGESRRVASGALWANVDRDGDWLSASWAENSPGRYFETFINAITGAEITIDGWWHTHAVMGPTTLLLEDVGEEAPTVLFDTKTGAMTPMTFPPLRLSNAIFTDGVVALARDDPDDAQGTLELLRYDTLETETLAADVTGSWQRTRSGTVVFLRSLDSTSVGTLVYVTREGEEHTLADRVGAFVVPFVGTGRERSEVLYFVADGPDVGLWRFALP